MGNLILHLKEIYRLIMKISCIFHFILSLYNILPFYNLQYQQFNYMETEEQLESINQQISNNIPDHLDNANHQNIDLNLNQMQINEKPNHMPRKPLTPYMNFIKKYKSELKQNQKIDLKTMGEIWRSLTLAEKTTYQQEYQKQKKAYDAYIAQCVDKGINIQQQQELDFAFANARIKAIMKQDPNIISKAQTVIAMNKATQFFGQHILNTVKRNIGNKKKVDLSDLWDAISTDKMLTFLRPLIDQKQRTKKDTVNKQLDFQKDNGSEIKDHIVLEIQQEQQKDIEIQQNVVKKANPIMLKSQKKIISQERWKQKGPTKGQLKLTDMFKKH